MLRDLQMEDQSLFQNFSRMSVADFEKLLVLVEPIISKEDTNYRKCISSRERLALTLRFLATGDSYTSLMYLFKISKQSVSAIVPEVCEALITVLSDLIKVSNFVLHFY